MAAARALLEAGRADLWDMERDVTVAVEAERPVIGWRHCMVEALSRGRTVHELVGADGLDLPPAECGPESHRLPDDTPAEFRYEYARRGHPAPAVGCECGFRVMRYLTGPTGLIRYFSYGPTSTGVLGATAARGPSSDLAVVYSLVAGWGTVAQGAGDDPPETLRPSEIRHVGVVVAHSMRNRAHAITQKHPGLRVFVSRNPSTDLEGL